MSEALAYQKMVDILKVAVIDLGLDVAYADVTYPALGVNQKPSAYLEVSFFVNDPTNFALGNSRERTPGIFQVTLITSEQEGLAPRLEMARQVANYYVKGSKHHWDGGYVKISKRPALAGPLRDGDILRTPISVEYEFFA